MLVCGLITRQTVSVVQDSWLRFQLFFEKVTCFQLRDTVSIRPKHEKECGWIVEAVAREAIKGRHGSNGVAAHPAEDAFPQVRRKHRE